MEKVLRMEFENEFGSKTSISIADPKASLTETQIKAAMNTIIEKGVFENKNGPLISALSAKIVETTEVAYDFA